MQPSFYAPWHPETPPETSLLALEDSLRVGKPFSRSLTRAERLTIALAASSPHSHLMVPAPGLVRQGAMQAWARLRKRLDRAPKMPSIAYVGTCVQAKGADGWHFHLLVWGGYLYRPQLARHAREAGLGAPWVAKIGKGASDRLRVVAYVLGQTEPVFCDVRGHLDHRRNERKARGDWSLLRPQAQTLRARQPEVLSALNAADDPSLSDTALRQQFPLFTTRSTTTTGSTPTRSTPTRSTRDHSELEAGELVDRGVAVDG